jgi:hypothetical protein
MDCFAALAVTDICHRERSVAIYAPLAGDTWTASLRSQ